MKIRLTRADLLEWLDTLPDSDRPLLTIKMTTTGDVLSVSPDNALADWLWREPDGKDASNKGE